MAENASSAVLETEVELTSHTSETNAGAGTGTSAIAPGYGTGRRKEAVARVRWFQALVSGPLMVALEE